MESPPRTYTSTTQPVPSFSNFGSDGGGEEITGGTQATRSVSVTSEDHILIEDWEQLARTNRLSKKEEEEEKEEEEQERDTVPPSSRSSRLSRGLTTIELERQSNLKGSLFLILAYFAMEIGKQLSNFSLSKTGDGHYPLPGALLVILVETSKLCIILVAAQVGGVPLRSRHPSPYFAIPACCYFCTNLFYLYGITIVSPPVWILLIQSRTLYVASFYKVLFKRQVTTLQWVGCFLIVTSIALVRVSQIGYGPLPLTILALSQVAAVLSSVASLSVEVLLKNDKRHYLEQQMWLYVSGILIGFLYFLKPGAMAETITSVENLFQNQSSSVIQKLLLAITCTSFAGVLVPLIVKNLDSIVKDYLAAMNNLLLSLVTAALFPDEFFLSVTFVISLAILIFGIFLYERKFLSLGL